jgi:hypothetical protein
VLTGMCVCVYAAEPGAADSHGMGTAVLASARQGPQEEDEYSDPDDPGYLRETAAEVNTTSPARLHCPHTMHVRHWVLRALPTCGDSLERISSCHRPSQMCVCRSVNVLTAVWNLRHHRGEPS